MDSISQPVRQQSAEYRKPVLTVFGTVGTLTQAGSAGAAESTLCMNNQSYCDSNGFEQNRLP